MVQWHLGPPRVRVEDNALELAHRAPTTEPRGRSGCSPPRSGRDVPPRTACAQALVDALAHRRHRCVLRRCSTTSSPGPARCSSTATCTRVERAPRAARGRPAEAPAGRRTGRSTATWSTTQFGLVVELDGTYRARGVGRPGAGRRPGPRRPRGRPRGGAAAVGAGLRHALPDRRPARPDHGPARLDRAAAQLRAGLRGRPDRGVLRRTGCANADPRS